MPDFEMRYTREELLKIRLWSDSTSKLYDWSHMDSLIHPQSKQKTHRIRTIIISSLSQQQTKEVQAKHQPKRRTLITVTTFCSVLHNHNIDRCRSNSNTNRNKILNQLIISRVCYTSCSPTPWANNIKREAGRTQWKPGRPLVPCIPAQRRYRNAHCSHQGSARQGRRRYW